jgi:hypothetical protein
VSEFTVWPYIVDGHMRRMNTTNDACVLVMA